MPINQAVREGCEVREVFAIADSVNDREQVRREHAKWSQDTFGNVGPVGPLKHLSKEALEAAAEPGDLSEWADMQFLLWDAQRRAGISDEQITQAMVEKLAVNKQREWPEPKDGEPRLHIKAPPAPVVPVAMKEHQIRELVNELRDIAVEHHGTQSLRERIARAVRAAMLQGSQPVSNRDELLELIEGMEVSVDVSTCDADAGHRYFGTVTEISELETAKNGFILLVQDAKPNFKQAGNSPVIGFDPASSPDRTVEVRYCAPPGYVMVPVEPTHAMINAWLSEVANWRGHVAGYKAALAAAPQQDVKSALEIGMSRYAGAMQKLADAGD